LLARAGHENDFAAKLERLLSDSGLRETLGENAELRMREKFSWASAVQECLAAYECALSKGKQADNSRLAAIQHADQERKGEAAMRHS